MSQKWEIYTRGTVPFYRIDMFDSLREAALKYTKNNFCRVLYAVENGKLWWGWSREGFDEWGKILISTLTDKSKRKIHYKNYDSYFKQALKANDFIRAKNLSALSNSELADLLNYLQEETNKASGMPNIDLDVFDACFEKFLQQKIKDPKIYKELSAPAYTSFISEEEKEIAAVASKKKINQKDVEKMYKKFWWLSLGWENIVPKDLDYFKKEVEKYSKRKDLKKFIKNIEEGPKTVREQRKKIIEKYKLGEEVNELLGVFDKFVYFHDRRKETQVRTVYSFNLILNEAAKRFNINELEKEWYSKEEILKILKGGKVDTDKVKERMKCFILLSDKSGIKTYSGNEAKDKMDEELGEKIDENIKELKGLGVSKGVVRAVAKVCNGIEQAREKIKAGDVLVTGMTLPDYVPVMKIAGAIITDEGGITCHAAIVSRELKKPCVVGTKIATQVLKDGDLVEVDAELGIVKILKK